MRRTLTWLVLLLAVAATVSGAVVGAGGRYPSPYVDDWSDVELRGTGVDASAATLACLTASGRAILGEGTYTYDPNGTTAVTLPDVSVVEGSGMGLTICQMPDNETGAIFLLGDDCTLRRLTLDAFDDSSTTGARASSSKHRQTYDRVEFRDFSTGLQDGGSAVNGLRVLACKFTSNVSGCAIATASTGVAIDNCLFNGNTTAVSMSGSPTGVSITGSTFVNETTCISANGGSPSHVLIEGNSFLAGTTTIAFATYGSRNEIGENYYAFDEQVPADVVNKQILLRGVYYGNASPSAGTWLAGERVVNTAAGSTTAVAVEWYCTAGGTSGTWTPLYRGKQAYSGTATWNPGSLDNGQSESTTVTVTGADVNDVAIATHDQNLPAGMLLTAQATGTNSVDVVLSNVGAGTQNVASGTVTVLVIRP